MQPRKGSLAGRAALGPLTVSQTSAPPLAQGCLQAVGWTTESSVNLLPAQPRFPVRGSVTRERQSECE